MADANVTSTLEVGLLAAAVLIMAGGVLLALGMWPQPSLAERAEERPPVDDVAARPAEPGWDVWGPTGWDVPPTGERHGADLLDGPTVDVSGEWWYPALAASLAERRDGRAGSG